MTNGHKGRHIAGFYLLRRRYGVGQRNLEGRKTMFCGPIESFFGRVPRRVLELAMIKKHIQEV